MLCHSCSSPLPDGARFCPTCGHSAVERLHPGEERRIVTVMFADVVGFTSLAEHRDPEQVKRLIDSCFEHLVDDIVTFGGRVDKILGDGILALFGAPVAHEDDAERAVRAALRMHSTLAAHVSTIAGVTAAPVRMRVGVNTGEVVVGSLAGSDYTAMGDVVNLAARLQTAAPIGGVLVGESTYLLTSHVIRYESAGEVETRGREQIVKAWLAAEATAPPGARRRRNDGPLIGRSAELTLGSTALQMMIESGRSVVIALNGDTGLGKSRLVDELLVSLRSSPAVAVLEGACIAYGESNVWWPLASALSEYLDIEPGRPPEQIKAIADQRGIVLVPDVEASERRRLTDVFLHLLGHPSEIDRLEPSGRRTEIHHAVARVLELRCARGPMVLSIGDLQWADPALVDLLQHLAVTLSRLPIAIITTMRPGSEVDWPPHADRTTTVAIALQPLSRADTDLLAAELLGDDIVDAARLTSLYERSGGNPLFLQELAQLNIGALGSASLPTSLRTLIGARLDQLTPEQRQLVDNAATLGNSGTIAGLRVFAKELKQTFDTSLVHQLEDAGLFEVDGSRWRFRSDSVREAAYQTLTKRQRAQRHAGVTRSLERRAMKPDDAAHHAASAAELILEIGPVDGVPSTMIADAIALLSVAAHEAGDAGLLRNSIRNASRALDLLAASDGDPDLTMRLRILRAGGLIDQRAYAPARCDIDAVLEQAAATGDVITTGNAKRLLGNLHHVEGRLAEARLELGQAVDLLRTVDDPALLAEALRSRGFIELFGGNLDQAEWYFGEADALFVQLGSERGRAWIEQHRAWASFLSGDLAEARTRLQTSADTLGRLGDRNGVGWALGLLAFVAYFERNFDEAEELAAAVSSEAEERGDEWAAAMMQTLQANLRLWAGQLDDGIRLATRAHGRFRKLNDQMGTIQSLAPLIRLQIALGQNAASQRSSEEVAALATASVQGPFPLLAMAGAAMHRGDGSVAVDTAQRAIEAIEEMRGSAFEPRVVLAMGMAQTGDLDGALAALDGIEVDGTGTGNLHPFTLSTEALVRAMASDPLRAIAAADAVRAAQGATYLDEVISFVAAGSAHLQLGDPATGELNLQAAAARAMAVGDVVATALATRAFGRLLGRPHPAADDHSPLGIGWTTVIDQLVNAQQATRA